MVFYYMLRLHMRLSPHFMHGLESAQWQQHVWGVQTCCVRGKWLLKAWAYMPAISNGVCSNSFYRAVTLSAASLQVGCALPKQPVHH